uniref:Uncharacterized protein n=1 Tax=virus sp. ctmTa7 TaxID=2828255 RepID=A0A8S5RCK0_9VIRU|nr:MAG TPA: hypothetical protein [virus sp. ctmTa7]DAU18469.1 MAG TPA: hypothetical protein [Bacteriophage sp.]
MHEVYKSSSYFGERPFLIITIIDISSSLILSSWGG